MCISIVLYIIKGVDKHEYLLLAIKLLLLDIRIT